jgi:ABC-type amino acid transport substrate-binding protein
MVYDDPLLKYLTENHFKNKLIVVDKLFELQQYGIAFPEGSTLREPINRVMLDIISRDEWQRVLRNYLGDAR